MGFTAEQIEKLETQIEQDVVSERAGAGGMRLSYIETHHAISKANEIFGFDGWSYEIVDLKTITYGEDNSVFTRTTAQVKVTVYLPEEQEAQEDGPCAKLLRIGNTDNKIFRLDVGHGNSTSKNGIPDFELSEKEAVSDALKRALRSFGNQFGNSLYDKEFLGELKGTPKAKSSYNQGKPSYSNGDSAKPASDKQKSFIQELLTKKEKALSDFTKKSLATLTSTDASKIIKDLQS